MGLVAHRMDTACINPAIVEIEQRADRDGIVDSFIGKAHLVKRGDVLGVDIDRVFIYFLYKPK